MADIFCPYKKSWTLVTVALWDFLNTDRSESVQINTMKLHYVMESLGFEGASIGKKGYLINKGLLEDLEGQYI